MEQKNSVKAWHYRPGFSPHPQNDQSVCIDVDYYSLSVGARSQKIAGPPLRHTDTHTQARTHRRSRKEWIRNERIRNEGEREREEWKREKKKERWRDDSWATPRPTRRPFGRFCFAFAAFRFVFLFKTVVLSFVYPRFIGRALCRVGSTSWRIMGRNKTTRPVYGASFHKESNDEAVRFGATGSPNGPRNRRKLCGSLRSLEKFEMALVFHVVLSNQWKEVIKVETSQQNCNSVKVGLSRYDLFFVIKRLIWLHHRASLLIHSNKNGLEEKKNLYANEFFDRIGSFPHPFEKMLSRSYLPGSWAPGRPCSRRFSSPNGRRLWATSYRPIRRRRRRRLTPRRRLRCGRTGPNERVRRLFSVASL